MRSESGSRIARPRLEAGFRPAADFNPINALVQGSKIKKGDGQ
jgi:hypothetical protein